MAIRNISAKFSGFSPLLQNNPQGINPFNPLQKEAASANKKYKADKTEENFIKEAQAGIRLRTFWDDQMGVYVPTRWVLASIAKHAYSKYRTLSKDKVRAAIFTTADKVKLYYDGERSVKTLDDVAKNTKFQTMIFQKIGTSRVPKAMPIFHKWSFQLELEFDDSIIDIEQLITILEYGAKYNGYGDFRPTYGRALCEVTDG